MKIKCTFFQNDEYTCYVKSAVIIEPKTKITAFVGTHSPGKSNKNVERIEFNGTKVEYFPRGLYQHFPNLRRVVIVYCGLKELTRQDLVGLENLTTLWVDFNELETLPPDLLKDMKKLKSISFGGNKLKSINSRTFRNIKDQLTFLDLRDNTNPNAVFDSKHEGSLGTIEKLMKIIDEKYAKPKFQYEIDREKAHNAFEQLWTSRRYSDFTIVVDEEEMKVHKTVLGTQSSVFATMFETDMEESKSGQVTIVDFSARAVEEFLQFLYTGEAPDAANAMEVFALAWKYEVEDLKQVMEGIIGNNIDEDNAIEVLTLGNLHSSEILISMAFDEIKLAHPELELADKMKNEPENVEKLIAAKKEYDQGIEEARNRFQNLMKNLNGK